MFTTLATITAGYLLSSYDSTPVLRPGESKVVATTEMEIFCETEERAIWSFVPMSIAVEGSGKDDFQVTFFKAKGWKRTREASERKFTEVVEEPSTLHLTTAQIDEISKKDKPDPATFVTTDRDQLMNFISTKHHFPSTPVELGGKWSSSFGRMTSHYTLAKKEKVAGRLELVVNFDSRYTSISGGEATAVGRLRFDEPTGKLQFMDFRTKRMKGLYAEDRKQLKSLWFKIALVEERS